MSFTRCSECLIPDTRPDTAFFEGVCSACRNFKARQSIDWAAREAMLREVIAGLPQGLGPNCIVPSSGGKDSTYQVIQLIAMGARPLVVTASTCYLTPIGRANIDNLARFAKTVEVTPNRAARAKLNKFGLVNLGDISYPEHMAIFSIPFQVALRTGLNTIFYGESPQQEYGCPDGAQEAMEMTRRWVHEFGGLLGARAEDCIGYEGLSDHDMADYLLPPQDDLDDMGMAAYFLGQFIPWDSHRNAAIAKSSGMVQRLPSTANAWDHENLDNAMTGIHDHMMYRKYGYGRLAAQLSVDIRYGRMQRDDALALVQQHDGEFPAVYAGIAVEKVLASIGVSNADFAKVLGDFTNWDLFANEIDMRPILK